MDVEVVIEWVIKAGALVGAIGVISQYLMKPIKNLLAPLNEAIERLNNLLDESQEDRARLHEINRKQNEILSEHDWRIGSLEEFKKEHVGYHKERIKEGDE